MRFEGFVEKEGSLWIAEVPLIGVLTQGRSRRGALRMIKDALETIAFDLDCEFEVFPGGGDRFEVGATNTMSMLALALHNRRIGSALTLADLTRRLDRASRNAFARYEKGDVVPTVKKLDELLRAIDPNRELVIGLSRC